MSMKAGRRRFVEASLLAAGAAAVPSVRASVSGSVPAPAPVPTLTSASTSGPASTSDPDRAAARVIVVGGGFAGASCARYLRLLMPDLAVTLIEPHRRFMTGPMSNAMLAGLRSPASITRSPAALASLGIRWLPRRVREIDPVRRRVRTDDGCWQSADRLVVAPGIAMRWDRIDGLDAARSDRMPHGWAGDASLRALHARLQALPDGATVLIGAPPNPYRCPPGPYERASLIAWLLRERRGKVLIADAKDDFSKRGLFQFAWDVLYPGHVEWIARAEGGTVQAVDIEAGEVRLAGGERLRPALASIVPPQVAAPLCHQADLVDASGWCPVHARNLESMRHRGVHVIGDAAAIHPVPKSAFAANSAAKLCAAAIVADLLGEAAPSPRVINTCYSLVAPGYGISVSGLYSGDEDRMAAISEGSSPLIGDEALREREARDFERWYASITRDSFG